MNYLITGYQGFIGKAVMNRISKVSKSNEIVAGFDTNVDKLGYLSKFLYSARPDVIFHIGACSDTQEKDINKMMILNVEATHIIAEYCGITGADLIYSSSASCYGTSGKPNTLYGWSKYAAEKIVQNAGGISLRYFNVYGNDESHKGKMASIAYQSYVKNTNKEQVFIFPKSPKRDFVYINDVVDANIHAFENFEELMSGVYDVGTGTSRTFEEVLDIMDIPYQYTDESVIPKNYQFDTCADVSKFMNGWKPKYMLEEGLADYLKILSSSSDTAHKESYQ